MELTPLYDIVVRIVDRCVRERRRDFYLSATKLLAARDRLNTLLKESA